MKLGKNDSIVAVVPERAKGPGWSNFVIWVYISEMGGNLRRESLQPDEWRASPELRAIADIAALVALQLASEVEKLAAD